MVKKQAIIATPPKMNKGRGFHEVVPIRTTIGQSKPPKRANREHIPTRLRGKDASGNELT